jgi:hypothetical protein
VALGLEVADQALPAEAALAVAFGKAAVSRAAALEVAPVVGAEAQAAATGAVVGHFPSESQVVARAVQEVAVDSGQPWVGQREAGEAAGQPAPEG